MAFVLYSLDQRAHDLVLAFRDTGALKQVYKMRTTVAYGLERFWGEHLRLNGDESRYWKTTWDNLAEILLLSGIALPNDDVSNRSTTAIQAMAEQLWSDERLPRQQRQVALAVLVQLCDAMVWWTQRYKTAGDDLETNED